MIVDLLGTASTVEWILIGILGLAGMAWGVALWWRPCAKTLIFGGYYAIACAFTGMLQALYGARYGSAFIFCASLAIACAVTLRVRRELRHFGIRDLADKPSTDAKP